MFRKVVTARLSPRTAGPNLWSSLTRRSLFVLFFRIFHFIVEKKESTHFFVVIPNLIICTVKNLMWSADDIRDGGGKKGRKKRPVVFDANEW